MIQEEKKKGAPQPDERKSAKDQHPSGLDAENSNVNTNANHSDGAKHL